MKDMGDGLSHSRDEMCLTSIDQIVGKALPTMTHWQFVNLSHISKAVINQDSCIQCGRCYIACEGTSQQAITYLKDGKRHFAVQEDECVVCNLCVAVCHSPVWITLRGLTHLSAILGLIRLGNLFV